MVSNTGDIPGTSGQGGSLQSSLGSKAGDSMQVDVMSPATKVPVKRRRGVRSKSFYKEAGRVKKHQRSMKRKARRASGRR